MYLPGMKKKEKKYGCRGLLMKLSQKLFFKANKKKNGETAAKAVAVYVHTVIATVMHNHKTTHKNQIF